MRHSIRLGLAVIAGLAWSLSATATNLGTKPPDDPLREEARGLRSTPAIAPELDPGADAQWDPGSSTWRIVGDLRTIEAPEFYDDILVGEPTYDEVEPTLAIRPDGTLFVAVEQHDPLDGWVRVYRSDDDGATWTWLVSYKSWTGSRNPALTYAERLERERWLFLACEATLADSSKQVVVIRFDPDNLDAWDAVPVATGIVGTPDLYPRLFTDDRVYDYYYVYVAYALNAIDSYRVQFASSQDFGLTYSSPRDITGGSENSSFVTRPDVAYGTAGMFVAFEKPGWTGSSWQTQVWLTRSADFGANWTAPLQLTAAEHGAWHPAVAAAVGVPTVMVAFTRSDGSQTDVYGTYSTDGGATFVPPNALPHTAGQERSVALAVSPSEGRYHAAFWREYDIVYTSTDAASPLPWSAAIPINEDNWVSGTYSRPTIAVDPTVPPESQACVAWTDFRGPRYDIYFDRWIFPRIFSDDFESGDMSAWF